MSRRPAWRRVAVGAAAIALVAAVAGVIHTVASRREALMAVSAELARDAVSQARAADAATWAPLELQSAEQASRDALTAQRIEQTRLWPIPDAERVAAAFRAAGEAARKAESVAHERRSRAAANAALQIESAYRLVTASETLAEKLRVGKERRGVLAAARLAVEEARAYQRAGDYRNATVKALRAGNSAPRCRIMRPAPSRGTPIPKRSPAGSGGLAKPSRGRSAKGAWRSSCSRSRTASRSTIAALPWRRTPSTSASTGPRTSTTRETGPLRRAATGSWPGWAGTRPSTTRPSCLDYPNANDRAEFTRAKRNGDLPPGARIGGLIEIHGGGGRNQDWTDGCVASRTATWTGCSSGLAWARP